MQLVPVDGDPFAASVAPAAGANLVPVDHDPFGEEDRPAPTKSSMPGILGDIDNFVRNIGTGLIKGAAGTVGLPNALDNLIDRGTTYATNKLNTALGGEAMPYHDSNVGPSSKAVEDFVFKYLAPEYKPETRAGEVAQDIAKPFGAGPIAALTGANLLACLGGAAGRQLYRGTPNEETAHEVGSLAGGLTDVARNLLKTPNAARMVAARTKGMTDADWARAQRLETAGQDVGVPLMGPESVAVNSGDPLAQLGSMVAQSPQGAPIMQKFAAQRGVQPPATVGSLPGKGQVQIAADTQFATVGPKPNDPLAVGNAIQNAAEDTVRDAYTTRTRSASPYYKAAGKEDLDPADVFKVRQDILTQRDNGTLDPDHPAYKTLTALADRLMVDSPNGPVPLTNAAAVDNVFKDIRDTMDLSNIAPGALPPATKGIIGPAAGKVGDLAATNPNIATGRANYKTMSDSLVAPLEEGRVGKISDTTGGKQTINTANDQLFNPKLSNPAAIRDVATTLNAKDPNAFRDMVRLNLDTALNTAAKKLQGGETPMIGANFVKQIAGNPDARANITAALQAIPSTQALGGFARAAGFNKFLDVLEATGRIPGIGSQTAGRLGMAKEASDGGVAQLAAKTLSTSPLSRLSEWVNDKRYAKVMSNLANAFTAPDSVAQLRKLASLPATHPAAQAIVNQMLIQAGVGDAPSP